MDQNLINEIKAEIAKISNPAEREVQEKIFKSIHAKQRRFVSWVMHGKAPLSRENGSRNLPLVKKQVRFGPDQIRFIYE